MKNAVRKFAAMMLASAAVFCGGILTVKAAAGNYFYHTVVSGDSLWKLGMKYSATVQEIADMNGLQSTVIHIGQKLKIPISDVSKLPRPVELFHTAVKGDTLWKISNAYGAGLDDVFARNGLSQNSILMIGQVVVVPLKSQTNQGNQSSAGQPSEGQPSAGQPSAGQPSTGQPGTNVGTEPYVTYEKYTVQKGDTYWSIGRKFGIPENELMNANKAASTYLYVGQVLNIPVHHVPVTSVKGPEYGEYLDWWSQAQYILPIGKEATVTDFYTKKSWRIRRTIGSGHADVETLTAVDTEILKSVFGGSWEWVYRPVIVEVDGRRIAASIAGMPHAGLDAYPADANVDGRSGNYGYGSNFDYIKWNGMDGHVDLHFANSTSHSSGQVVSGHQDNVKIAAGK